MNSLATFLSCTLFGILGISALYLASSTKRHEAIFVTPLVVDLNRNGKIDLISAFNEKTPVYFNFNGDPYKVRTGWVGTGDGLLVLDVNKNGVIDNGTELFGPYSKRQDEREKFFFIDGFEALSTYDDAPKDNVINSADKVFARLLVWRDKNSDGVSQKEELISLEKAGIESISLEAKTINANDNLYRNEGNEIRMTGTYMTKDKKTWMIADVWLRQRSETDKDREYSSIIKKK